jgi:hypothetical protein
MSTRISYEALKAFGKVKLDLAEITGSDDAYYAVLLAYGYRKSNEIQTNERGLVVYIKLREVLAEQVEQVYVDYERAAIREHGGG